MSELLNVLEALETAANANQPAVFCVVLEKRGSAPRGPGAAMMVGDAGSSAGTVGGGAIEVVTEREARTMLAGGEARQLTLSLDDNHGQDDASVCGGEVSVGLVPLRNAASYTPFLEALAAARRQEPAHLPITIESAGRPLRYKLHIETPPTLVIVGAGHVGQALARLAGPLGFRVVVIDDRPHPESRNRFADTVELRIGPIADTLRNYPLAPSHYVAIMTRGHRHDQAALEAVIRRPLAYVGMMASRRKAAAIFSALRNTGVPAGLLDQVHTPIGLSIGAADVNEIAVSIAAELVQVRRRSIPQTVEGPA